MTSEPQTLTSPHQPPLRPPHTPSIFTILPIHQYIYHPTYTHTYIYAKSISTPSIIPSIIPTYIMLQALPKNRQKSPDTNYFPPKYSLQPSTYDRATFHLHPQHTLYCLLTYLFTILLFVHCIVLKSHLWPFYTLMKRKQKKSPKLILQK